VREESGWAILQVEDNGQGIPPEHQPRIFELFYRGAQSEMGTGLGLYILKRSVDRLQGTVEVTSDAGVGSTFTVRLPSLSEIGQEVVE
jgi:signal transduction histidine kinase